MCAERSATAATAAACAAAQLRVTAPRPRGSPHHCRTASLRSTVYIRRSVSLRRGRGRRARAALARAGPCLLGPAPGAPGLPPPPARPAPRAQTRDLDQRSSRGRGEETPETPLRGQGETRRRHSPDLERPQASEAVRPSPQLYPTCGTPSLPISLGRPAGGLPGGAQLAACCSGSCGGSWGGRRPRRPGGRGIDRTPSAAQEGGLEGARQLTSCKKLVIFLFKI